MRAQTEKADKLVQLAAAWLEFELMAEGYGTKVTAWQSSTLDWLVEIRITETIGDQTVGLDLSLDLPRVLAGGARALKMQMAELMAEWKVSRGHASENVRRLFEGARIIRGPIG